MTFMTVTDAATLISLEYAEIPDLSLTFWQIQRLCNLSDELCDRALKSLLTSGVLRRTEHGTYVRRVRSCRLALVVGSNVRGILSRAVAASST